MRAVISDAPIPLTTLNPAFSIQLASVVMKALEKSPEKRFQSANAFRSALLEGNTLIEDTAVAHLTFSNQDGTATSNATWTFESNPNRTVYGGSYTMDATGTRQSVARIATGLSFTLLDPRQLFYCGKF
jgi:hypothetical protein